MVCEGLRVFFFGVVECDVLLDFYCSVDVFVFLVVYDWKGNVDGLLNVIFEVLVFGLLVIVLGIFGIFFVVESDVNGYFIEEGNGVEVVLMM